MNFSIKSRSRKLVNPKLLVFNEDAKHAYKYYCNISKQFQLAKLPNDLKNIMLSFNSITVTKSKNSKYYQIISGWRDAQLLLQSKKSFHVTIINDDLSSQQIQLISWTDVLKELLSSCNHKFVLAQTIDLFNTLPSEIYNLINVSLKKKTPLALTQELSQETRDVVRKQNDNFKRKKIKHENSFNSEEITSDNEKSILSSLISEGLG